MRHQDKNPSYTKQETTRNCYLRLLLQAMVNNLISSGENKCSRTEEQAKDAVLYHES